MMRWPAQARLWETLATNLDAGLPPDRALAFAAGPAGGATARIAAAAAAEVARGVPLSQALAAAGEDPLACAMVAAGERSGHLPPLLRRIGEGYRLRTRLRDMVISRMAYPVLLAHVAVVLLPLPSVVSGSLPGWTMALGPLILWTLAAAAVASAWYGRRAGLLANAALRWPLSALCWPALAADLGAVLGAAIGAGMLAPDALELAATACANRRLAERLREQAAALRAGRTPDLATALSATGLDGDLLELMRTGEGTGRLEQACDQVRTIAADRFAWRLQWTARVATGLLYAMAMLIAAATVFSMYSQTYGEALRGIEDP